MRRGAIVRELMVYEWQAARRRRAAVAAIDAILGGDFAILALTSQIQLRHMLDVAGPAARGTG